MKGIERWLMGLVLLPFIATGQFRLAKIFTDHMVLQRDQPLHIWGKGSPGKIVSASFAHVTQKTKVSVDSSWSLYLPAQPANSASQSLLLMQEEQRIELLDVLVGDIWVCIGQSNMEFPMASEMHFKEEVRSSDQPLIRFYNPTYAGKGIFATAFTDSVLQRLHTETFYEGNWQRSDSNSIRTMSAVGYYFGKKVVSETQVPVGLIHLAIGGCPVETFMRASLLANSKDYAVKVSGNWLANENLPEWVRQRGRENVGNIHPRIPADNTGPAHGYKPGFAFAAGIEPILAMPVKGILWYQGESNAQEEERVHEYDDLLQRMIEDYRHQWKQPGMPFYWVQLSSIDSSHYKSGLWPWFRDEQRRLLLQVKHGGMAVCSDVGARNNIHPTDKRTVGDRLARWALVQDYGKKMVASGPLPFKAEYQEGKIILSFSYADGLTTSDGKAVRGFSLDGKTDMPAIIHGQQVIIDATNKPAFVYYGWKPYTDANLVNAALLPASTFKLKLP